MNNDFLNGLAYMFLNFSNAPLFKDDQLYNDQPQSSDVINLDPSMYKDIDERDHILNDMVGKE